MANVNPIKLIACDVDGTLIAPDGTIPDRNREAIAAATAKGVHFVLASARPPRMARPIYDELALSSYQINYNGAVIQRPTDAEYAVHRPIEPALARRLVAVARRIDPQLAISLEVKDQWFTDGQIDGLTTATSLNLKPDYEGPLDAVMNQPITKVLLLIPPERMSHLHRGLRAFFRHHLRFQISDAHLIQAVQPQADKHHGVQWIANHYGVSPENVLTLGDAPNDAGMLRWAHTSVAVANAWPEAQDAAKHIANVTAEQGAVGWAIEKFVLA
ncbi:MAG: HAD family hydrolase [Phycisphaeraceae bacterium]